MDKDIAQPVNSTRLKRDLSRDAISLALAGEWERAVGVNRAILELFGQDVGAMNRLSKALMETGRLDEAKDVLREVANIAPYNTIAKKNLARLDSLNGSPISTKQGRRTGVVHQLFIEESGKSGTTFLRKTGSRETSRPGRSQRSGQLGDRKQRHVRIFQGRGVLGASRAQVGPTAGPPDVRRERV